MLAKVEAYSSWPDAPELPLSDHGIETDLIQIRNIDGLGPVKATVNTSPYGSMDGAAYSGSLVPVRNIVITLGLNPDWNVYSMESLRRLVYSYFMSKQNVRLVFYSNDEMPTVEIYGYVEDVVPSIFSKDVEMQVSIICPDPYFTSVNPIVVAGIAQAAAVPREIIYHGSIETGIFVKVTEQATPDPNTVAIQLGDPAVTYFRVTAPVTATKYLVMNSIPGNKYVQNVELGTGVITNLLAKASIEVGSIWPTLVPGRNEFSVITNSGIQDWELTYFERFGGL